MTLVQLPDSGPMPIRLRASLVNSRIQPAMDGWGFDPFFIVDSFFFLFSSFLFPAGCSGVMEHVHTATVHWLELRHTQIRPGTKMVVLWYVRLRRCTE